ncbi:MAG: glycosyltransferase family 39 protein [Planctomycetota bacterium]
MNAADTPIPPNVPDFGPSGEATTPVTTPADSPGGSPSTWAVADDRLLGVILLIVFACSTCLIGLRSAPALGDHEAINAVAARNAIETGRWLIPHLGDVPRIRKMPLGIWLIGAAAELTGDSLNNRPVSEFSARLPSAIAGVVNALLVFWLGSMLFGHRGGLIAGFLAASCAGTLFYAYNAQVEMILTACTTLTFACFWRGAMHPTPSCWFMAAFYVAFALAMMAKAPLPLAVVGLSLFVYWFLTVPIVEACRVRPGRTILRLNGAPGTHPTPRWLGATGAQFRRLGSLWIIPGVIVFLIVAGAWPLYVYLKIDNALDLWRIEYLDRYTGELSDKVKPVWYYIPIVFAMTFPFLVSIPEAVIGPFLPRYAKYRRGSAYALTWALIATAFVSTAAFKRPHYVLSALPAFCLLLAPVLERLFFGTVFAGARTIRAVCVVIPVILAGLFVVGGVYVQRHYPALLQPGLFAFGAALLVWCTACVAFARNLRASSFALVLLSMPLLVVLGMPIAHRVMLDADPSARALAKAFTERGIGPSDDIFWADSRPNETIEFYSGLRIRKLVDEIELAGIRDGRRSVSADVRREIAERMAQRLKENQPAYMILSRKHYERLAQAGQIPHRVLFRLDGLCEDPEDDLVVFTQPSASDAIDAAREEKETSPSQKP